jgi:UDP-N-acetylmuramate--alanine ligase
LTDKQVAYFIGIKGVGMTMLAQFLKRKNWEVTGSDNSEVFLTDKVLADAKITVYQNFSADNVNLDADLIVYSSAYNDKNNPELKFLKLLH